MIEADASKTHLNVYNRLELSNGASFNVEETEIRTLVVVRDASICLQGKVSCDTLEVLGTVKANINAGKGVSIEKEGSFNGSIEAPSLAVAEGAALKAKLKIEPGRK